MKESQNRFGKQVDWNETDCIGLLGGGELILSGTIAAIVLKYAHKPVRVEELSNS